MDAVVATPAVGTGTSAEVLQHYLTAGIEVMPIVESRIWTLPAKLEAISVAKGAALVEGFTGWQFFWELLPVLRPFSALCDTLPDGTVPAVEVAKLVGGNTTPWAIVSQKRGCVILQTNDDKLTCRCVIKHIVQPEWGWHFDLATPTNRRLDGLNVGAAYDYLRRNQFALPVNGRPLVEGVDFIAKATPVTA